MNKEKDLGIDDFRGETIYSDIYAQTVIRQGYMRQVEIFYRTNGREEILVLPNKLAVERTIDELKRILKEWV